MVIEVSLAVGARIPRYELWLRFHELGVDPEGFTSKMAAAFCDGPLHGFLAEHGFRLGRRERRKLLRSVERYDPALPTPEERLAEVE